MNQRHDQDSVREQAALYALGALDADEARDFERHLDGCAVCAAEVEGFLGVVQDLGHAADPEAVDPSVRTRVFVQIDAEDALRQAPSVESEGVRFVRTGALDWANALPGISIKPLFAAEESQRATHLVRMEPGARYPAHRHADVEELYVLEGDLLVSGVLMRAGDYCRASAQSVHSGIRSPSGCVFLVTACRTDEILSDPPDGTSRPT